MALKVAFACIFVAVSLVTVIAQSAVKSISNVNLTFVLKVLTPRRSVRTVSAVHNIINDVTTSHTPVSAVQSSAQLPAVYPLVNILLPLLNNVYNLLLSLLSIFDTLPPSISCLIPVDLSALETSLLKLYSQALAIVNFLRSLPEYAAGACPSSPPSGVVGLQGLLTTLVSSITDIADDVLVGIGGGLLPGLLQLVLATVRTLLELLI